MTAIPTSPEGQEGDRTTREIGWTEPFGCDSDTRLSELSAKVESGRGLTMAERMERQGIIFNHHGDLERIRIQIV